MSDLNDRVGNRALPESGARPETTQRLRVYIPRPRTHLNLGQYLEKPSETEDGFGYPGLTLSTEAGAFVDVKERSVWQGRDSITFQSAHNLDLLASRSVNVCSVPRKDWPADKPFGTFIDTTQFAKERTEQLQRHVVEYNIGITARLAFSAVKSVLSGTVATAAFKALSIFGNVASGVTAGVDIGKAFIADMNAGVQISSHDSVWVSSGSGQAYYAAGGFSFVGGVPLGLKAPVPASFTVSVPLSVTLLAGATADMFGTVTASVHAGYAADLAAIKEAGVFSRIGEAMVIGDTVSIGSKLPGKQILKVKANPLFQRPTRKVSLSALETVIAEPIKEFVVNAPLGLFTADTRKVYFSAKQSIKYSVAGLYNLTIEPLRAKMQRYDGLFAVQVGPGSATLSAGPFSVKATTMSLTAGGAGSKATFTPAGVKVDGPIIKLG
ncbi:MAG: hypothetical protein JNK72_19760 [Myxococcales bacterium]|nr:hypothetical protein [Myxococcales bacterium]